MKKKVGIIARGITDGGVKRFITNILRELDKIKEYEFYLLYNQEDLFQDSYKRIRKILIKTNKLKFDYIYSLKEIKRLNLGDIIYTKNTIPRTHIKQRFKKYLIIHDMGHFIRGLYPLKDTAFMRLSMGRSVDMADKILSVSEFTKKEIVKTLGVKKDKIKVIGEGINKEFRIIKDKKRLNKTIKKLGITEPFFLYPSEISHRKNTRRILRAFNEVDNQIPHHLYITGGKQINSNKELRLIKKNTRIKVLGHIKKEVLIDLYNLADACIYPSLYEGFGLPILEAQACGCPVITSNTSSMPEVAGRGALFVNPREIKEIKDSMIKILEEDLRTRIKCLGLKNIRRFNWKTVSKKILEVFK